MRERAAVLHDSPWQGVLHVAGGGAGFIAELLTAPGASRTVLEVVVPYSEAALTELLGGYPVQFCSEPTARALAMAAFQRARSLGANPAFGLGCTASLATDREKRGEHRAHIAVQTRDTTYVARVKLAGDRPTEERALLEALWAAADDCLHLELDLSMGPAVSRHSRAPDNWQSLVAGETDKHPTDAHDGALLFPGAFNPLHHAHRRMMAIAEQLTGHQGAYELSIVNADKPMLDYVELESRLRQFDKPVWLTRLPTFLEKARNFPGARFVVGADTLLRIIDPRYYQDTCGLDAALSELVALDATFVVFGRTLGDRYHGLSHIDLPPPLADRCIGVTQEAFHESVSSTELRQRQP